MFASTARETQKSRSVSHLKRILNPSVVKNGPLRLLHKGPPIPRGGTDGGRSKLRLHLWLHQANASFAGMIATVSPTFTRQRGLSRRYSELRVMAATSTIDNRRHSNSLTDRPQCRCVIPDRHRRQVFCGTNANRVPLNLRRPL